MSKSPFNPHPTIYKGNLMQAQIQLIQSLQRSSLPANSMNSITNRFGAQTGAHNPLAALQQQAGNSGSNKVQQPAQAPTIQQPVQQPQQVSRETAALPSRGSVGGGSRSQGHGLSNKDSFKEEQAKQRQEIIQVCSLASLYIWCYMCRTSWSLHFHM